MITISASSLLRYQSESEGEFRCIVLMQPRWRVHNNIIGYRQDTGNFNGLAIQPYGDVEHIKHLALAFKVQYAHPALHALNKALQLGYADSGITAGFNLCLKAFVDTGLWDKFYRKD